MKAELTDWAPDLDEGRVRVTITADLPRSNTFEPLKAAINTLISGGAE